MHGRTVYSVTHTEALGRSHTMTPDWPVIIAEIAMLPLTVSAAVLGAHLHKRDQRANPEGTTHV